MESYGRPRPEGMGHIEDIKHHIIVAYDECFSNNNNNNNSGNLFFSYTIRTLSWRLSII